MTLPTEAEWAEIVAAVVGIEWSERERDERNAKWFEKYHAGNPSDAAYRRWEIANDKVNRLKFQAFELVRKVVKVVQP